MSSACRIEVDSPGTMRVPAEAYYGARTAQALDKFPVSGLRFPRRFIRALGLIKRLDELLDPARQTERGHGPGSSGAV